MPIWGLDPIFAMRRRDSLVNQVVAVNLLLVTGTLFGASVAVGLDLTERGQQFVVLAWGLVMTMVVNALILRRRFAPLEKLIEEVEQIDPSRPGARIAASGDADEVARLAASFQRLLERVEDERIRAGRMVLRAQEDERRRIARDLHDEVNQALTAILLRLQAVKQVAPEGLHEEIAETARLANQAMEELLRLSRQLRPSALDDHGVAAAVQSQAKRFSDQTGLPVRLRTRGEPTRLTEDQEIVLYRVAQEALSNVAQHSGASRVAIDLVADEGQVTLRVRDDGIGFDPGNDEHTRAGLAGMTERARLVGGRLDLTSSMGQGSVVTLRLPERPADSPPDAPALSPGKAA